jgi:hypothetical protein
MCIKGVVMICGGGASRLQMENAETGKGNAPIRAGLFQATDHARLEYGRGGWFDSHPQRRGQGQLGVNE